MEVGVLERSFKKVDIKKWVKREIPLVQRVIEDVATTLSLDECPRCEGNLSREDSFGTPLHRGLDRIEAICGYCELYMDLNVHYWRERGESHVYMRIFTNTAKKILLADSGVLAEREGRIELNYRT